MTTLFDLTLELAGRLGVLRDSLATSGSTTTIVDSTRDEEDNEFDHGVAWIIWDAGDADAAPEGEYGRITAWDNATTTFTVDELTAAVAVGDRYAFTAGRYPLDMLTNSINNVIRMYRVEVWDKTSLDVVSQQSEYDLPSGIYQHNLIGVYVSTVDDDNDNQITQINYRVEQTVTGTADILVINLANVSVDNDIYLHYWTMHPRVKDSDDVIDDLIPLERILAEAAYSCELTRMRTYGSESKLDIEMLGEFKEQKEEAARRFPVRYTLNRGNINDVGGLYDRVQGVALSTE